MLAEYPPERVARICGLKTEEIVQLARDYGTIKPAAIRLNYGMQRHAGGGIAARTIACLPALIGACWGAPLVARELETGTFRLAWNQSVTRTRWLAVKLAVVGLTTMAVTEGLSLMQAWWAAPLAVSLVSYWFGQQTGPLVFAGLLAYAVDLDLVCAHEPPQ